MVVHQDGLRWQPSASDAVTKPCTYGRPVTPGSRPCTPSNGNGTPRGSVTQQASGSSALKSGAGVLLYQTPRALPAPNAVARATARQEMQSGRHRLPPSVVNAVGRSTGMHAPRCDASAGRWPPPLPPSAETPDAVARLCEAQVWGPDIDYAARDSSINRQGFECAKYLGAQSCFDDLVFGHDMDFSGQDKDMDEEAKLHGLEEGSDAEGERERSQLNVSAFKILSWHVQSFIARVRRQGVRGFSKIMEAFKAVSVNGAIDLDTFIKAAMKMGLCRSNFECGCAFRLFADPAAAVAGDALAPGTLLQVANLAQKLGGSMDAQRAAIVQDVWKTLDPTGGDEVEMRDLLAVFDARWLPCCQYGEMQTSEVVRHFVESFSACGTTTEIMREGFALNEAEARRRPYPVGGRGVPLETTAGQPSAGGFIKRSTHDVQNELAARRSEVNFSKRVSAADFHAYYACISITTIDDLLFEKIVRSPWTGKKVHEEAEAPRRKENFRCGNRKGKAPAVADVKVLAVFEDGSRRMVRLLDNDGLQETAQDAGGVHCNQMWTWGPNVKKEVIRRLEAQGYQGIATVKITPS